MIKTNKKTKCKRLVSLILVFAMLLALVPNYSVSGASKQGSTKDNASETTEVYGDVSALSSSVSTIEGNKSSMTKVIVPGDITLDWAKADPTIYRYSDGWWVGIKVTAPGEKLDKTATEKMYYQTKTGDTWSAKKSFWKYQDSDVSNEDAIERFITLWGKITPEFIEKAKKDDTNIEYKWQFDWNNDNNYEQQIVLSIEPKDIILMKNDEQAYPYAGEISSLTGTPVINNNKTGSVSVLQNDDIFLEMAKADPSIGRDVDGWWTGIKMTAPSDIELSDSKFQVYEENHWSNEKSFWSNKDSQDTDKIHYIGLWGLINNQIKNNAKHSGKNIEYKWQFDWDNDGEYEQLVVYKVNPDKVTLVKADQKAEFKFTNGDSAKTITYGDMFCNSAFGGENTPISYKSSDDSIAKVDSEGNVTALKSGKVTISAINPEDERYYEKAISYELTIKRADQTVEFEKTGNQVITYGDEYINTANANTSILYKSSDESIATVDSLGKVSAKKAGTVIITASAESDECYNAAVNSYELKIQKAKQNISFKKTNKPLITFNDNDNIFVNTATSDKGITDCEYSVISGNEYIDGDINTATGEIKIKGAGEIIVFVLFQGNDCYRAASAYYTLTVKKAEQPIGFKQDIYEYVTGVDIDFPITAHELSEKFGTGKITYTIKNDDNGIIKGLNVNTGEIELSYKSGEATVIAKKAEDNNYTESLAEYSIKVNEWIPNDTLYYVDGNKNNDSGWFSGNVSIKTKDGYQLSYTREKEYSDTAWTNVLDDVVTDDTNNGVVSFYIKDNLTGYISKQYTEIIKKDTVVPEAHISSEKISIWEKFLTIISFGLWDKEAVDFYIESNDMLSGVADIKYYISNSVDLLTKDELDKVSDWQEYNGKSISVNKNNIFTVYAKVTDKAGNYVYASTNGIIFDAAAADINIELPDTNNGFYSGSVEADITVTDFSPSSGIKNVEYWITCDEKETQRGTLYNFDKENPELEDLKDKVVAKLIVDSSLNNSDDVVLNVKATDNADNETVKQQLLKINAIPPALAVEFDNNTIKKDTINNVDYYNENRKAQITITGRTSVFSEKCVNIEVTAKDAKGKDVSDAYTISSWTTKESENGAPDEATHTATITFTGNAVYNLKVSYADLAGNKAEDYKSEKFAVDKDNPIGTVSIDENIWDSLIEKLTFGLWKNYNVSISTTSDDATSPVKSVEYYKTNATNALTKEELDALNDTVWKNSISVNKNELFVVYVKITDIVGNYTYISSNGFITDTEACDITFTENEQAKHNGYYNSDAIIGVDVKDSEPYSGIKSIEYWVTCDEKETQRETLYSFDAENPEWEQLTSKFYKDVVVDSSLNNSDNIKLCVKAVDNAGNENVKSIPIKINAAEPVISVEYLNDPKEKASEDNITYYDTDRKAQITITGRTSVFSEELVDIDVTAKDAKGNDVSDAYTISSWTTKESENGAPDEAIHTATITFTGNAVYDFQVSYEDKSGNQAKGFISEKFAVDKDNPTGTVSIDENIWKSLIEKLTFGLWKNDSVSISTTSDDATSPVKSVEYYKTDNIKALTENELDNAKWEDNIFVSKNERFVVYVKITDIVGNYTYISSNGFITDTEACDITFTENEQAKHNGYYNSDAIIGVDVKDSEPYSGIKSIEYWVMCDGQETQRDSLYNFDKEEPAWEALKKNSHYDIEINKEKNNSDKVELWVKAVDNAGNENTKMLPLKIDITKPKIDISFDNNDANVVNGREYYKANRTATIIITERTSTFDADIATKGINISNVTDSKGKRVEINSEKMIGEWVTEKGKTPDEDTHKVEVVFDTDANYTFSMSYVDKAGNENEPVKNTPIYFTVDKNAPKNCSISVNDKKWDKLLSTLTYGLFDKNSVRITASADDDTSPVNIEFYKTADTRQLNRTDLEKINNWINYNSSEYRNGISVNPNEQMTIYLRVTDYAGNRVYLNSEGVILDNVSPVISIETITSPSGKHHTANKDINVYNSDVDIKIDIKDAAPYSGINYLEYWVTSDGKETQRERFNFAKNKPVYSEIVAGTSKTITVDSKKNNSCNVTVNIKCVDNAGNEEIQIINLDIDITKPVINVIYDNNKPYKVVNNNGYYAGNRIANVMITERTAHFNEQDALNGISITARDINGNTVINDCSSIISNWSTEEKTGADKAVHTATISYTADANYTFNIWYKDTAGNQNDSVNTGESVTPYLFTVDANKPTGKVTVSKYGTWDKIVHTITFGIWSKDTVTVSGTASDVTSPIESISYYKCSDTNIKSLDELNAITEWKDFTGFEVPANEKFIVYLKIVDFAGNTSYVSTDGIIVDNSKPAIEEVKPEISIEPERPINGIYNKDVRVAVKVTDPANGITNAYSGIQKIYYEIFNMGEKTQEGTLYNFDIKNPLNEQLLQTWSKENAIIVDKNKNNSNNVVIKVYAVDNAGNKNEKSTSIKIDITKPSISVLYDNNNGDTSFAESTYFKADRTATIIVTERNFDKDKVKITIKNEHGTIPKISDWKTVRGKGNGDDTTHTAKITYKNDGDYKFNITCEDKVGNPNKTVDFGLSLAPKQFTIDKTIPTASISYDNNKSKNGNYYKEARVATITVKEHNFDASRAKVNIKATDNGKASSSPSVSNWTSNGDIHTATIRFGSDSLYTVNFDYADRAGNNIEKMAKQTFYIDKTAPKVSISEIVDESANNTDGKIGFVITATDTNFDIFKPILTATIKNGNNFETKTINIGETKEINNGVMYVVDNIDSDGIYNITCTAVDKAGNAYNKVILQRSDGATYVENRKGQDTLLTFSVNREGSTFMLDENTSDIVKKYYVQNVTNDIVVVEINADPLKEYTVSLNDKKLVEDQDYTISQEGGKGAWLKYTYKISKKLFDKEGEYKIIVSSKDKADNDAFSDVKEANIDFIVDRTAPLVSISGLASNGRYQTDKQKVTIIPSDAGGALNTLIIRLIDDDGETIKEIINCTGDELEKLLEKDSGNITFDIGEGLYQNVQIICSDCAVDENGQTNVYNEIFNNISVSSSAFMIFWANKPLRYGIFGGIGGIILLTLIIILLKRKRKNNA